MVESAVVRAAGGKGNSKRTRAVIVIAPLLLIGLAVFVVALNIRHYSGLSCDSESARDIALNRAALEKRVRTLEGEALENALLLEAFIRKLDDKFGASSKISLAELRRRARIEAQAIHAKRIDDPPPPIPLYMEHEIYAGLTSLGGEVGKALKYDAAQEAKRDRSDNSYGGSDGGVSRFRFGDENGVDIKKNTGGWDWDPQMSTQSSEEDEVIRNMRLEQDDEYYQSKGPPLAKGKGGGKESKKKEKDDIFAKKKNRPEATTTTVKTDAKKDSLCKFWLNEYHVLVNLDWGKLPFNLQQNWLQFDCNKRVAKYGA